MKKVLALFAVYALLGSNMAPAQALLTSAGVTKVTSDPSGSCSGYLPGQQQQNSTNYKLWVCGDDGNWHQVAGSSSGTVTTTGTPASGDIAAFSGSTSVTTATSTQINTLIKTLTGCNTANYVYVPQSATCVYMPLPTAPIYKGYTYVADATATAVTSPSYSVTAGDLLVVACRYSVGGNSTVTDSGSNTWTRETAATSGGSTREQLSWAVAASTTSVTFTCTAGSSGAGLNLIAMSFSNTSGTKHAAAVAGAQNSVPAATMTITSRVLVIDCMAIDSASGHVQPGTITGVSAVSTVGDAGATLTTNASAGCIGGITTSMLNGSSISIVGTPGYSVSVGTAFVENAELAIDY